jgi:hypothetical protein
LCKMSNFTKWATCRWNIDLKKNQLGGALGNIYVSSNYGCYNHNISNSHDDDFFGVSLGGMGYSHRLYKKTIPNCKFIKGRL